MRISFFLQNKIFPKLRRANPCLLISNISWFLKEAYHLASAPFFSGSRLYMMTLTATSCVCRFGVVILNRTLLICSSLEDQRLPPSRSNSTSSSTNNIIMQYEMAVDKKEEGLSNSSGELALRSILGANQTEAKQIIKRFPAFNTTKPQNLSDTLQYLMDKGISLNRGLKNPWLLLIPPDVLEERLQLVMDIISTQSIQVGVPFVAFKTSKLLEIGALWKLEAQREPSLIQGNFPSRIEYLAKNLRCSDFEVADFMVRVNRLPFTPFSKIETILCLLLEGGVNPSDIVQDPWIFVHNISTMKERMSNAHVRHLTQIKPWMLRCSLSKYESYVQRTLKERGVKPKEENIDSFLQRRLNLSSACVNDVLSRVPSIKRYKASKLESMISFLLGKGFSSHDIAQYPRILEHSVATVATRVACLAELTQGNENRVYSLSTLSRSSRKFISFVDAWKSNSFPQIPSQQITNKMESAQSDRQAH